MSQLSEQEIAEFREAFQLFDKDGDDTVTTKELGLVMNVLGENPTEAELQEMINALDEDGNGTIEFVEMIHMLVKKISQSGGGQDDKKEVFNMFDKDGDGFISANELKEVMSKIGESLSDEDIHEMILIADNDGDARVSYEDFLSIVTGMSKLEESVSASSRRSD